jgi:hypothetical protein
MTLRSIRFRVVSHKNMRSASTSDVEAQLNTVVASEAPSINDTLQVYKETLNTAEATREEALSKKGAAKYSIVPKSWYLTYRRHLIDGMRYHEHELFDAPVAIFYVVSSTNSEPVACFEELQSAYHLPEGFGKGIL